jgi:hypothetical protein
MRRFHLAALLASSSLAAVLALARQLPAREDQPSDDIEVLARGPVHEALAEPTEVRPQPSPVVPRQPPAPVDELPPDQRPEGDNVIWIPGYWAWDNDRNDFIWVSGVWRDVPPGRQWVPGTWQKVDDGWQWTPGFWSGTDQEEVQYLPTPPASLDDGPSSPAPDDQSTYVSGCWVWNTGRYMWRPGFWHRHHPGWVWVPAHYICAAAGCLFVGGYWDYPLENRGLLFAPVIFRRPVEHVTFVPSYVVQPDFLISALFVSPATYHYYYGDYFSTDYTRHGFIPWVDYRVGRAFDPNYAYYRHVAGGREWETGLKALYAARFAGTAPRPPRTLVQQEQIVRNLSRERTLNTQVHRDINITHQQNVSALAPLSRINNLRVTHLSTLDGKRTTDARPPAHVYHLQPVAKPDRVAEQRAAARFHEMAQQRNELEAKLRREATPARPQPTPARPEATPARPPEAPRVVRLPVVKPASRPPTDVHPQPPVARPSPRPPAPKPPAPKPPAPKPPPPKQPNK